MIEKLTSEQEQQLKEFHERCMQIGLSTDRMDKSKHKTIINHIYKKYLKKEKEPHIWYVDSPFQYNCIINILNLIDKDKMVTDIKQALQESLSSYLESDKDQRLFHNVYWSNADIYWIGFYMFPLLYLGIDYGEDLNTDLKMFFELIQDSGYIFYHEDICFISEKPIEIHTNENHLLHNESGPSILFADGYFTWHLNGVEVNEKIVMPPADQLSTKMILEESNAEVRKEILKKIGIDRVISEFNAQILEKKNGYVLYDIPIKDSNENNLIYLKMENPSTDEIHFERVHFECKTVEAALAYRDGEDQYIKPDILT